VLASVVKVLDGLWCEVVKVLVIFGRPANGKATMATLVLRPG